MGLPLLTRPFLTIFGRSGVSFGSSLGRFGVDFGSISHRFGVVFGSIWGRFGIALGSVWDRFGIDFGSVWDHISHRGRELSFQDLHFLDLAKSTNFCLNGYKIS